MPTKEQLTLDVIAKKNTTYLPSQIEFANLDKKMEVAKFLGMKSESEVDEYLGNHIKWVAILDDVPNKELHNPAKMAEAAQAGRTKIDQTRNRVTDPWGMEFALDATGYNNLAHPLEGLEDDEELLAQYPHPDITSPGVMDTLFAGAVRDMQACAGDYLAMLSGYNGIWEKSYNLVGMEDFMCLLLSDPDLACRVMDVITEYKVSIARETGKRGFKIGHYGDDLGTQVSTLVSEDVFVKYFKPRIAKVFAAFKESGIPVQMHSCGFIVPFIPHLIEIGLDVLEPVQSCMDPALLKREFGNDLTFYGGVDTQELLAFKSPDEVYEQTLRTIDILGKGGGYICGPSQEIMNNVPVENTLAMARAIRETRGE